MPQVTSEQPHHVLEGAEGGEGDAGGVAGSLLGGQETRLEGAVAVQDDVRPQCWAEK